MRVSMVATAVLMVIAGAQAARAQGWQPPADSAALPVEVGRRRTSAARATT